eukprot:15365734-Ditylum_brightwellii.AAC.1
MQITVRGLVVNHGGKAKPSFAEPKTWVQFPFGPLVVDTQFTVWRKLLGLWNHLVIVHTQCPHDVQIIEVGTWNNQRSCKLVDLILCET